MEPVDNTAPEPKREGALIPLSEDIENQMLRARAETISSEESQFEMQINDLLNIFSDVQKIEDEQYVKTALEVLSRDRKETYRNISPYLSRRLRESYNEVRELTEARNRSSLKKLMKQLIADSINDAFVKMHYKREEEAAKFESDARKSRMILAGVIVTGVATTLAAFLAAYFGHSC